MLNAFILKSSLPIGRMQRLYLFELSLYAVILAIALGIPFFTGAFAGFGWKTVYGKWLQLLPFVLVFAANNFLFVPKLLFREKYPYYILACALSVIAAACLSAFLLDFIRPDMPHFESLKDMKPLSGKHIPPPGRMPINHTPLFFHFGTAIISILLIGFNTGVKSFVRWSEEKIERAEKDRYYFYTELALLKHQISPHFFMNTLNNIHALVDINRKRAKDAIIKLSNLMRYMLYETDMQKVTLKKEIDFIESYIELMRLRYDEHNLTITTEYPDRAETVSIPSFLFLSFVENAFKHGVNPRTRSSIAIGFSVENDRLTFRISNSRWDTPASQPETTGIGLENVRKRLDLIYRGDYMLDIHSPNHIFEVILNIPVS